MLCFQYGVFDNLKKDVNGVLCAHYYSKVVYRFCLDVLILWQVIKDCFLLCLWLQEFCKECQGLYIQLLHLHTYHYFGQENFKRNWESWKQWLRKFFFLNHIRLGLLFGPIIGSVLNALFGFSVPFFVIAIFFILAEIPIYL